MNHEVAGRYSGRVRSLFNLFSAVQSSRLTVSCVEVFLLCDPLLQIMSVSFFQFDSFGIRAAGLSGWREHTAPSIGQGRTPLSLTGQIPSQKKSRGVV